MQFEKLGYNSENHKLVQVILNASPNYSIIISGQLPSDEAGKEVFEEIPPNISYDQKIVLGVKDNNSYIGVIDYLVNYPKSGFIYLGLLLLKEEVQSKGLGVKCYLELEQDFRKIDGISKIRLSVVEENLKAIRFWKKVGFQLTGEKKAYENKKISSYVLLMEKVL